MLVLGSVYNGKICIVAFYIKAVGKPWLVKVDWLVVGSVLFACVPVHNLQISTVIFTVEWKRCAQIWKKNMTNMCQNHHAVQWLKKTKNFRYLKWRNPHLSCKSKGKTTAKKGLWWPVELLVKKQNQGTVKGIHFVYVLGKSSQLARG